MTIVGTTTNSTTADGTTAASGSQLLALAAELRLAIWEHALVEDNDIMISWTSGRTKTRPSFLAVNRQIRAEAAPMYYQQNTFRTAMDT